MSFEIPPSVIYYLLATVVVLINCVGLLATLLTLPGNWLIVAVTALFAWLMPFEDGRGITWGVVIAVLILAIVGEIIEFVAGAAGAAKQGASRRAMVLSVFGATVGSIFGAFFGSIIPAAGTVIGAIGGAALGSFGGAYLGETWKGKDSDERLNVSVAALTGRLLGTMGKLSVGAIMVVVVAVDAYI